MAIDADGTRITDLAGRMRITRQATGELVRHLQRHGYVVVASDPVDQRARLVALTDRGWAAIRTGLTVVDELDRWLAGVIGGPQLKQLRDCLIKIIGTDPTDR